MNQQTHMPTCAPPPQRPPLSQENTCEVSTYQETFGSIKGLRMMNVEPLISSLNSNILNLLLMHQNKPKWLQPFPGLIPMKGLSWQSINRILTGRHVPPVLCMKQQLEPGSALRWFLNL